MLLSVTAGQAQALSEFHFAGEHVHCKFQDGSEADLPGGLQHVLRPLDILTFLSSGRSEILIQQVGPGGRPKHLLHATVGYVSQPKQTERGGFFVRAELPNSGPAPRALFLAGVALRQYFYLLHDGENSDMLYGLLQAPESATLAELRLAWRVRSLELGLDGTAARARARTERAFNILAHPDLRRCYDALRRDEDAPPLFPYGGFGSILVEGHLSDDGEVFFGNRILAYKPQMTSRRLSLLLRRCEFFDDRVICRDPRRKVEVWLDGNLLPDIRWDLTWNHWKHWLRSRIEVEATLVHAGKYRLRNGEWTLREWFAALPSRIRVTVPEGLPGDVEQAKAIHRLLGQHADVVKRVRAETERQPVEHSQVQRWLEHLGVSSKLKPQHITWRPDYEPYYFEQLRKRSRTWFLFRDEYLFIWRCVLIAEVPQPGHATYLFAQPDNLEEFLRIYTGTARDDVRRNRNNVATTLGFVGRVVRGRRKKRWLAAVLKEAGEKADYVEVI